MSKSVYFLLGAFMKHTHSNYSNIWLPPSPFTWQYISWLPSAPLHTEFLKWNSLSFIDFFLVFFLKILFQVPNYFCIKFLSRFCIKLLTGFSYAGQNCVKMQCVVGMTANNLWLGEDVLNPEKYAFSNVRLVWNWRTEKLAIRKIE